MKMRNSGKTDYWQSYSDMMAALLLIFMMILVVNIIQLNNAKQEEKKAQQDAEAKLLEYQKLSDDLLQKSEEIEHLQDELDEVLGIKQEIITSMKDAFKKENIDITVDENTGAIQLKSTVAFDWKSATLSENGKTFLQQVIPVYIGVLMRDEYWDSISQVCIEGYCDSRGSYNINIDYSEARAKVVTEYILEVLQSKGLSDKEINELKQKICITGRSKTNLICVQGHINCTEGHKEDLAASRRVEIKFQLDDSKTAEKIQEILEEQ